MPNLILYDRLFSFINLEKLMKGKVRAFRVYVDPAGTTANPTVPAGKCWLILSGDLVHVTLTVTGIVIWARERSDPDIAQGAPIFRASIAAATPDGSYDIFGSDTIQGNCGWRPILMPENSLVDLTGDNAAAAEMTVLEFEA